MNKETNGNISAKAASPTTKKEKKKSPAPKPTNERVSESVHLVRQLSDVGIGNTHPHMVAFREILNKWIRDPEFSYNGRVDFDCYGRRGDLVLPRTSGHVSSIRLRAL